MGYLTPSISILLGSMFRILSFRFPSAGELLVEVAALALFYHVEILVVEFALLKFADGLGLCFVLVVERLLQLLVEPLENRWLLIFVLL